MALTKVTYSMIEGSPINLLDFGADPSGTSDSSSAVQSAIEYASTNNHKLYVPSGTYLINTGILIDEEFNICIEGDAAIRPRFVGTQTLADAGSYLFLFSSQPTITGKTITVNVKPNEKTITLDDISNLEVGMCIHMQSNVHWPYEDIAGTPDSATVFKGEIHQIIAINTSTKVVTLADSTRDSYATTESVTIRAWRPSKLGVSNLEFYMPSPSGSQSTRCFDFGYTIDALIKNCKAENATFFGFRGNFNINARYKDIQLINLGNSLTSNGYGITDRSNLGTRISGLYARGCRRAYDSHSNPGVTLSCPNRDAIVERFEIYGGGFWWPDASSSTPYRSSALGMHGPSEGIRFTNGFIRDVSDAFKVRGKSTTIQNVTCTNLFGNSVVECTYGTGIVVQNVVVDWDNYPNKLASLNDAVGNSGIATFVDFGGGDSTYAWDFSISAVISNNTLMGGVTRFIGINSMSTVKYLDVNNNIIQAVPGDSNTYNLIATNSGQSALIWKSTFIGNVVTCLNGTYQMNGANVNLGNTGSASDLVTGVLVDNRSYTVFMQDDSVHMLRFDMEAFDSSTGGLQRPVFMVSGDAIGTGMIQLIKQTTTLTQLVGTNPNWVAVANGTTLTGTTGVDGNLTFGLMNDGRLYIENRTGLERSLRVSFIA